ncbi:hypothetical protein GOBAR_AA21107 [Gossypium barbadense]|uniref:Uncharacterized protein n=1 Tax=Gossypium barbadense TaxID=3634 RepID=A0A2P5X874_GOSBA|nr:hypothetical protein GOBAR_AA21107 [Gossypium barbadense]
MWCYEEEKEDSGPAPRKPSDYSSTAWRLPSAPRMVPRVSQYSSSAKHETKMAQQSSAPLNIPDWTLKGRDLSKVRNAVLTKTGFLE